MSPDEVYINVYERKVFFTSLKSSHYITLMPGMNNNVTGVYILYSHIYSVLMSLINCF